MALKGAGKTPHCVCIAAQDDNKTGCYILDADTGAPTHLAEPPCLELQGGFVFGAGSATGRLASCSINGDIGEMTPLAAFDAGWLPMRVLTAMPGELPATLSFNAPARRLPYPL